MRARWVGVRTCHSCLATRGGEDCDTCNETGTVLCDECGDVYPHSAAEYHTSRGELCTRCFEHLKDEDAAA